MIRAWRREDGLYRLEYIDPPYSGDRAREYFAAIAVTVWEGDPIDRRRFVKDEDVDRLGVERMYGVVAGPSSCGCEPAGFRWVAQREVEAGKTDIRPCPGCSDRAARGIGLDVFHQCDIIDVCGEADEAEAIYASEFAHKVGALT